MKSYIFTLGFHEDFIIRRLHSTHVNNDDQILVITTKPLVGATKRAIQNLEAYCVRLGLKNPNIIELEVSEFYNMVSFLMNEILKLKEPLIVDITGGMRILGAVVLISVLISGKDAKVYVAQESGESQEISFSSLQIRGLLNSLSKEKVLILNEIYKSPGVSVDDLARITGKSRKTIINHIIELKNLDIIVQKGKNSGLFLTKLGELLIKRSDKELTEDQVE